MSEFESPQATPKAFNAAAMIGGIAIAICAGAIANVIAGVMAIGAPNGFLGFLIGVVPGGLFIVWGALLMRKPSAFGTGLLIGGCIVALVGGACGAAMVGTTFH